MRNSLHSYRTAGVLAAALVLALAGCSGDSDTAVPPSDCTPQHQFDTVAKGKLTVATYAFPPHTIIEGDKLSGVEGDLLNEIAKRECLTLAVESAGGASAAVPSVQTGRADLAAGSWWRTKARAEVVSLSSPLYLDQAAIISKAGYKSFAELDGKKVGSVGGNLWNDEVKKAYGDNFTVYQDADSVYSDLAADRIDAVLDSVAFPTARFQETPIEGAQIVPMPPDPRVAASQKPGQINWPNSKNNAALTEALNANIEAMHADGTIANALKKAGLPESLAEVGAPWEA
jgi:polar amino acid transport system substrate-binding protein